MHLLSLRPSKLGFRPITHGLEKKFKLDTNQHDAKKSLRLMFDYFVSDWDQYLIWILTNDWNHTKYLD